MSGTLLSNAVGKCQKKTVVQLVLPVPASMASIVLTVFITKMVDLAVDKTALAQVVLPVPSSNM